MRTHRKRLGRVVVAGAAAVSLGLVATSVAGAWGGWNGDRTSEVARSLNGGRARNVILFLGDGMGDSEITIARNYDEGAAGRLTMDTLPLTGEYTTYAVKPARRTCPTTSPTRRRPAPDGRPGTRPTTTRSRSTPSPSSRCRTILELAQKAGLQDRQRHDRRAHRRDAGGARLARQPARLPGPGRHGDLPGRDEARRPRLDRRADGRPQGRRADGRRQGALRPDAPCRRPDRRPAGAGRGLPGRHRPGRPRRRAAEHDGSSASSPGNMDLEWTGPLARRTPVRLRRRAPSPNPARPADRAAPVGHDDQGDRAARREDKRDDRKGFFLQVEGASIDKQDHAANPCGQIGETVEFDAAIAGGARQWAEVAPRHADRRHRRPRPHEPDHRPADRHRPQPRRDRDADHRRRPADGRQLRRRTSTAARRATPAPRCASRPRARRRPTWSASPTRPTCSTR